MNILTFDVEEWFHILDNKSTKTETDWQKYESRIYQNMDRIFEVLDSNDQKATFFCLGWIANHYPDVIRRIQENGHEIACHSNLHQLAYEQTPQEFEDDLTLALNYIEEIIGKKVTAYRAPGFSLTQHNKWVFEILIKSGITVDSSIFPASRAHGGFSDFGREEPTLIKYGLDSIREFPINTHKFFGKSIIFSGGGYFRLLPYWMIRSFANDSSYVMTYFHPRDFDTEQPMIKELSLARKFKSYYGLKTSQNKLARFVKDRNFISLGEAEAQVNWDTAPVVSLEFSV